MMKSEFKNLKQLLKIKVMASELATKVQQLQKKMDEDVAEIKRIETGK